MNTLYAWEHCQPQGQYPLEFDFLAPRPANALGNIPHHPQYLGHESTVQPAALESYRNEFTPDYHAPCVRQQRILPGGLFPHGSMSDTTYLYPPLFEPYSSSNTPSPISPQYAIDDISNASYLMDGNNWSYPSYNMGDLVEAKPSPPPMPCQWGNCGVVLDDLSHSGLRRHFREYHTNARGTQTRCIWGQNCRSESMLFENIPKHIAECHLKTMKEECPGCGNSFARKDTLKRHLNSGGCPAGAGLAGQAS